MRTVRMQVVLLVMLLAALGSWLSLSPARAGQGPNFDRLSPEDRQMFQARFEKEIWPLLVAGGKDGCVDCHAKPIVSALKLTGDVRKDFPKMLRDGFFLPDDAGSLLGRILDTDKKRRMPPGDRPRWPQEDISKLRQFVEDMHKQQKK
jgi:hypothetical protein